MCCRDLPDPEEVLAQAIAIVPAPPIADVDPRAIYGWIERVRASLVSRREANYLARQIEKALDEEWATRRQVERTQEAMEYRDWLREQREAGTYWQHREAGRVSQRGVRIHCSDEVWARAKDQALRRGVTLGEFVGHLVATAAARLRRGGAPLERITDPEARTRYLRIAADAPDWIEVKAAAKGIGAAMGSYVGMVVGTAARRAPQPSP